LKGKLKFIAVAKGHLVLSDGESVYFTNLLEIIDCSKGDTDSLKIRKEESLKSIPVRSFHILDDKTAKYGNGMIL
jgi:hypothetical protein